MESIYEANAPTDFPSPTEQLIIEQQSSAEKGKTLPMEETVERRKKEILDKIQYLRQTCDQANQDKESLSKETDSLKQELAVEKKHAQELERRFAETLDAFNDLLDEISRALQT
jgi:predicted secreted protein